MNSEVDSRLQQSLNDRYQLIEVIARGSISTVYKARHSLVNRNVAIKLLAPELSTDRIHLDRFQHEASCLACILHPNVLKVHDFGVCETGQPYIVMDFIEGRSLSTIVETEGPLQLERFQTLFGSLCDAVAHVHKVGIVHRDIKPANILVATDKHGSELPVLIDFYLSSRIDQNPNSRLTQFGEIVGTPHYMSPEQCMGQPAEASSDIYSMGCTMFFALTGEPPFQGKSLIDTMQMHMANDPPAGKIEGVLDRVIARALAKDPRERYESMSELGRFIGKTQRR